MFELIRTSEAALPKILHCPCCGNAESFHLIWLGDLSQPFHQDPTDVQCEWNYDSYGDAGDRVNLDTQISCSVCRAVVAERRITLQVGAWEFPKGPIPHADDGSSSKPLTKPPHD